ncbi:MAG: hypothetical protein ABJ205_05630 [Erythrobacter sp.]|uniref:hypothetical protein n=1 Tax=Erythrobacter sp. TaxID=1042 RepID=UPI003265CF57
MTHRSNSAFSFFGPAICAAPFLALSALTACSETQGEQPYASAVLAQDPIMARALNDPLMTDPDLASRNQSNAVIAFHDSHPLPPLEANEDAASRAREAARLELLSGGQVESLPLPIESSDAASLGKFTRADDIIKAVGSRDDCIESMNDGLLWSTQMPETSAVMPHGMVQQAAGADTERCVVRVVRYHTPVSVNDALEYHFTKATREGFVVEHINAPEAQLRGEWRDENLAVHGREGPRGLTEIDVIHWIR